MSRFDKIKNLSIFNDLTTTPSTWYQNSNLTFQPDEMVVRQITYNGPPLLDNCYMIWSNITNDFIGSFAVNENSQNVSTCANVTPGTVIKIAPNSVPQSLQFTLYTISSSNIPVVDTNSLGMIIINLDFYSYKK